MGRYGTYVLSLWLVTAIAVMGLNLTLGLAGLKSLAQAAFMGIGAYATGLLTTKLGMGWLSAFAISGLLTFAVGLVLGFPALRVKAHYLAFVTLAFSTLVWLVLRNEQWLTGGVFGLSNIPRPTLFGMKLDGHLAFHRFVVLVTLILALALWWLIRSPWGRAFLALRENPVRAASLGINIRNYTLLAFAIGSAYAGFAGALYAPLVEFIDPSPFALSASFFLLLMVVAGGSGYQLGPFIGALLGVVLPEYLRVTGGLYLILFAAIVVALLIACPQGIMGLLERGWNAIRRRPMGRNLPVKEGRP
ncbi:MAG: branched-chain amino acid ABC transporter permease [Methylobacterium sp.]|jgi:branched-chain amino acid transport system permease protein|nr:branched-chain amino acid ABC transporter permease [Methylobacterium sp.]MCA3601213.1 branched-chain amino acid ABC transporter permease [Methylobacterium sp.]MCA3603057.1 branched-chain amino acid ABC transporter permease [Methylobacterium sp.]MCA3605807.1 branched-chain amino acid ABC transporter permease [Methylobacterium sp.]MCA3610090.1 branched-chain amino acid ABC transporter permease [Methylobacterium sp.]